MKIKIMKEHASFFPDQLERYQSLMMEGGKILLLNKIGKQGKGTKEKKLGLKRQCNKIGNKIEQKAVCKSIVTESTGDDQILKKKIMF